MRWHSRGTIADVSTLLPDLDFNSAAGGTLQLPPTDSQPVVITCPPVPAVVTASLMIGAEDLGAPAMHLGEEVWRWEWQPRGRAGAFAVQLTVVYRDGLRRSREYELTVAPGKIEGADFEQLLAAVQSVGIGLIYALQGGRWGVTLEPASGSPSTLIEHYWRRLAHQASLANAVTRSIDRQPYSVARQRVVERALDEVTEVRPEALVRAVERPLDQPSHLVDPAMARLMPRSRNGRPQLPRSLPIRSTEVTSVTYEHRLLARVLAELQWRCGYIREELRREIRWRERFDESGTASGAVALLSEWEFQAGAAARSLQRARSAGFLLGVEPTKQWRGMTDLMRRDHRYRGVARLWRLLSERPFVALQSPAFEMPVRDLPALYELWCLLEVARCLCSVGALIDQQLFTTEPCDYDAIAGSVWKVRLAEDTPIVRWRRADGAVVTLSYQRRYRPETGHGSQLGSLDPFLRIPDIVVEVRAPGCRPEVIVFDAKYRIAPSGGIPEDALADAYAYHAAIGWEGAPVASGVYLLFPGREGFDAGSVGAIPLIPGQTAALDRIICTKLGV